MSDDVQLEVHVDRATEGFLPLEEVQGVARWSLPEPPEVLEVRLFWATEGRGDRDFAVAWCHPIARPPREGEERFSLRLPAAPYSFSGQLVTLRWAFELVHPARELAGMTGIVLGPGRREVRIDADPAAPAG